MNEPTTAPTGERPSPKTDLVLTAPDRCTQYLASATGVRAEPAPPEFDAWCLEGGRGPLDAFAHCRA